MTDTIFIIGLLGHYFADFVLQTSSQALNKSKQWSALIQHTASYSMFWLILLSLTTRNTELTLFSKITMWLMQPVMFAVITFITHTAVDYVTSRWSSYFFGQKKYRYGFQVVGFDQVLHFLQLYFTYKLLF